MQVKDAKLAKKLYLPYMIFWISVMPDCTLFDKTKTLKNMDFTNAHNNNTTFNKFKNLGWELPAPTVCG